MWSLAHAPLMRTAHFASPPDNVARVDVDAIAWRAPCPDGYAHRLDLMRPPRDGMDAIAKAFDRWEALQGNTHADRRVLQWETSLDEPSPTIAPRYAPYQMLGMSLAGLRPTADSPFPIRHVQRDEIEILVEAAAREQPALGPSYRDYLSWTYRGLALRGAITLAAWQNTRPVASAALVLSPDGAVSRLREVWTARDHRRRGIAFALICRLVNLHEGLCYVMAEAGGGGHRLYEALGFLPVSRVMSVSSERVG